jgi:hypothetical protein
MQYTVSYINQNNEIKTVDVSSCNTKMDAKLVVSQLEGFRHFLKITKTDQISITQVVQYSFEGEDNV